MIVDAKVNPVNEFDVLANESIQNPFEFASRLREKAPVYWNERYSFWMISRHDDVKEALRMPIQLSSRHRAPLERRRDQLPLSAQKNFDIGIDLLYGHLQASDPPIHTEQRQQLMKAFAPIVPGIVKTSLERRVHRLLDSFERAESCDFVKDVAYPLSSGVIFDLLGVPAENHQIIFEVAKLFMMFPHAAYTQDCEALEGIAETAMRARDVLGALVKSRHTKPGDDLISALVHADGSVQVMSDDEIVQLCTFLLVAGHETTANLMSGSMRCLLEDRQHWDQLLAEPAGLPGAIDELLRFVSPVLWVGRFTTEAIDIGGQAIPKGCGVMLGLGSANHDPDAFPDPDVVDLTRKNVRSLAFGHGVHSCVGAAVTRMETQAVLAELLKRMPNIQLKTREFEYAPVYFVRSLKSLPISIR
jgi:cytochrome P450